MRAEATDTRALPEGLHAQLYSAASASFCGSMRVRWNRDDDHGGVDYESDKSVPRFCGVSRRLLKDLYFAYL